MWQQIAVFAIVGLTASWILVRALRNRHREGGGCSACGETSRRPRSAPTYLMPMESLTAIKPTDETNESSTPLP